MFQEDIKEKQQEKNDKNFLTFYKLSLEGESVSILIN